MDGNSPVIIWVGFAGSIVSLAAVAPLLFYRFARFFSRKNFIVIGPPAAGKSSLLRVMEGKLPRRQHIQTQGLREIEHVNLNLGGVDNLYFRAKVVREIGGEFTFTLKSSLIEMNPDGIIIVIDRDAKDAEADVLVTFGKALLGFYEEVPIKKISLRSILIVINKFDLVREKTVNEVLADVRIEYATLFRFLSTKLAQVHVNVCCGSITEAQFFAPVEMGIRFLARGTK